MNAIQPLPALAVLLIVLTALSGCGTPAGHVDIQIQVLDSQGFDIDSHITLHSTQDYVEYTDSGSENSPGKSIAEFTIPAAPDCTLLVRSEERRTDFRDFDCTKNHEFTIKLGDTSSDPMVRGRIWTPESLAPRALVLLDQQAQWTNAADEFLIPTGAGNHTLRIQAPCHPIRSIAVQAPETLDIRLNLPSPLPDAPASLEAVAGPGPGMLTLTWNDVANATGFELSRNGQVQPLGHSLAYTVSDAHPDDLFAVRAVDACNRTSAWTESVSDQPMAGFALPSTPQRIEPEVTEHEYSAYDAHNRNLGRRSWRIIALPATGLAVTPAGTILAAGPQGLSSSRDAGQNWMNIPVEGVARRGDVANAPDGDAVAFIATGPNSAQAFRCSATGTCAIAPVGIAPGFGQPRIGTIKGPLSLAGQVASYTTIVQGTSARLESLDGLTYTPVPPANPADVVDLRTIHVSADANRDWIASSSSMGLVSVDNGLGYSAARGPLEPAAAVHDSLTWLTAIPPISARVVRVDSLGDLHALTTSGRDLTYAWSHDGGATWGRTTWSAPLDVQQMELRVDRVHNQALIALRMNSDGADKFQVLRFVGLDDQAYLQEQLDVGSVPAASNQLLNLEAFELALGVLPSGKAVVVFRDALHEAAIAVEE